MTLKDREWTCDVCGSKHDRDINAAMNIKSFGLNIYPELTGELTPVENRQPLGAVDEAGILCAHVNCDTGAPLTSKKSGKRSGKVKEVNRRAR
jgi:hypothetical protein